MRHQIELESSILSNSPVTPNVKNMPVVQRKKRPLIFSVLASVGVFGGISALFVGLVFVVIHGILAADVIFDKVGTGLLIAALPMILLGSICIDEIEEKK